MNNLVCMYHTVARSCPFYFINVMIAAWSAACWLYTFELAYPVRARAWMSRSAPPPLVHWRPLPANNVVHYNRLTSVSDWNICSFTSSLVLSLRPTNFISVWSRWNYKKAVTQYAHHWPGCFATSRHSLWSVWIFWCKSSHQIDALVEFGLQCR